jgi:hypothetical protein
VLPELLRSSLCHAKLGSHHPAAPAYVRALQGEMAWESFSVAGRYLLGIADALYPRTTYHGSH